MCNSNIFHKRTPTFEKLHISPYIHSFTQLHTIQCTHYTFLPSVFKIFTPRVSQSSPLKGISSRDYQSDVLEENYLRILMELRKVFLKIIFSFPGGFFCSMVVPQDLIHFNLLSSSASLFGI
jgi:hypothetical protein